MALLLLLALQDIPFERIPKAGMSMTAPPCEKLIRDEKSWKAFWELYTANTIPPRPAPKVDFAAESVVAVVWGRKPGGGFVVDITRIVREGDVLLVHVLRRNPPRGAGTTAAVEEPAVVVRAKLPDLPLKFVDAKP